MPTPAERIDHLRHAIQGNVLMLASVARLVQPRIDVTPTLADLNELSVAVLDEEEERDEQWW